MYPYSVREKAGVCMYGYYYQGYYHKYNSYDVIYRSSVLRKLRLWMFFYTFTVIIA